MLVERNFLFCIVLLVIVNYIYTAEIWSPSKLLHVRGERIDSNDFHQPNVMLYLATAKPSLSHERWTEHVSTALNKKKIPSNLVFYKIKNASHETQELIWKVVLWGNETIRFFYIS